MLHSWCLMKLLRSGAYSVYTMQPYISLVSLHSKPCMYSCWCGLLLYRLFFALKQTHSFCMWFYMSEFLNIHWSVVLAALAWLVLHETAAISACSVYTIQPCTLLHKATYICKVHVYLAVICHLHFWQNDQGLLHATAVIQGWKDSQIRVGTESGPWRRTFSCQIAITWSRVQCFTTELSPLTML